MCVSSFHHGRFELRTAHNDVPHAATRKNALILPTRADRTRMELRAERSRLADDLLALLRRKYVN
ncbi:hypothetical protein JI59_05320 [Novosphingobium pentaromativorans US6-1]|nr:hypothetical protein JI59_05320 [Novosphingobium pentaromativorans US6-1]